MFLPVGADYSLTISVIDASKKQNKKKLVSRLLILIPCLNTNKYIYILSYVIIYHCEWCFPI